MNVNFTGYVHVNQCDKTWSGGFVGVNCLSGTESSLEECAPEQEVRGECDCARLRCEPGT